MPEKINTDVPATPTPEVEPNEGINLNKNSNQSNWNDKSRVDWNDNGASFGGTPPDPNADDVQLQERGKDRTGYDNGSNLQKD